MTLHHILQGFSTSDCDWLMPPGQATQRQSRVSVTDALKRRELLEEFIFWYFTSFLLQLLKVFFFGLIRWCSDWWLSRRRLSMSQKHPRFVTKCYISGMTTGKLFVHPWSTRLTSETFEKDAASDYDSLSFVTAIADNGYCPIYQVWGRRTSSTEEARFFIRPTFTKGDGCTTHS